MLGKLKQTCASSHQLTCATSTIIPCKAIHEVLTSLAISPNESKESIPAPLFHHIKQVYVKEGEFSYLYLSFIVTDV